MKYSISHATPAHISPARFQEAMARYARAGLRGLEINKAIEAEVNEVLARYEHELQCTAHTRQTAFEMIRNYCIINKRDLFSKRRSMGTPYGVVGFRLGTPRLKVPKQTKWNNVLAQLKQLLPGYVRTVEEPAKDMLLADRNKEHVARVLMDMGIEIVQEELFYVDTKQAA